jgi:hypothetical protein
MKIKYFLFLIGAMIHLGSYACTMRDGQDCRVTQWFEYPAFGNYTSNEIYVSDELCWEGVPKNQPNKPLNCYCNGSPDNYRRYSDGVPGVKSGCIPVSEWKRVWQQKYTEWKREQDKKAAEIRRQDEVASRCPVMMDERTNLCFRVKKIKDGCLNTSNFSYCVSSRVSEQVGVIGASLEQQGACEGLIQLYQLRKYRCDSGGR